MLGDAEYAFTVFSWSMVIGPPPKVEKAMALITSTMLIRCVRMLAYAIHTSRSVHDRSMTFAYVSQTLHTIVPAARNDSWIFSDPRSTRRPTGWYTYPRKSADS